MKYKGYTICVHYFPTGWEWDVFESENFLGGNDLSNRGNDEEDAIQLAKKWIDSKDQ